MIDHESNAAANAASGGQVGHVAGRRRHATTKPQTAATASGQVVWSFTVR